jgi:phage shock protein E
MARPVAPLFRRVSVALLLVAVPLSACGDDESTAGQISEAADAGASGLPEFDSPRLVGPAEAPALLAAPPDRLVVLDIRTPEEFAEGYLEDAVMIDFQAPTFTELVSRIDRDAPIFLYCRSGNRSAQAVAAMVELGFTDITELDGGVIAWAEAGLPFVTG